MKIELKRLTIENFKGIKDLDLELDGADVSIKGQNGTGKTTVADAFFWLFSNSNSDQRSNFNIIPLDQSGMVVNFIKPTVEAVIKAGDLTVKLKKIYKQVWTKSRGSEAQELTGHTTEYFFDEVPVSKGNYEKRLNEIIKADIFRSLADVKYFCSSTLPQYRRNVLLDVTGGITDEDIIIKYSELAELPNILNGRSIEDYRKVLNQDRRAINRKLDEIPASIKERMHGRPEVDDLDAKALAAQIDEINQSISESRQKIYELGTDVDSARRKADLVKAESDLSLLEQQIKSKYADKRQELVDRKGRIMTEISRKANELDTTNESIRHIESLMTGNEKVRDKLIASWVDEDKKIFKAESKCFACGQTIPNRMIDQQRIEFDKFKDNALSEIEREGERLYQEFESLVKKYDTEKEHIEFINTQIEQLNRETESVNAKLSTIDTHQNEQIEAESEKLRFKIKMISDELKKADDDISPKREAIEQAITALIKNRDIYQADLDKISKADEIDVRIKELEADLKAQGRALERNAYEVNLLDKFIRRKAEFIEETVSGYFDITEWKLFDELVGGGYKDICEPLYNGIPYNTDLNTGARINLGLDVISTLSRHYNIQCPIFIDNAESITEWISTENQEIRLIAIPEIDGMIVEIRS